MNICRLADRQVLNRCLAFNPKGWQTVAGGRSDSGDLRRRYENTGTPKAVPERRQVHGACLKKERVRP
jgi:hypothetical protein